jgi:hypothetical protein
MLKVIDYIIEIRFSLTYESNTGTGVTFKDNIRIRSIVVKQIQRE